MLDEALKVVEAARQMRLVRKDGRTLSELPHLDLAVAIEGMRAAIEAFDRETGASNAGPAPAAKPEWASPPQMADEGYRERHLGPHPGYAPDPAPEEEPSIDGDSDLSMPEDRPTEPRPPRLAPEALAAAGAAATLAPALDIGDEGAFFDGDESAADLMLSINTINDKLGYAVCKVGWSPRLRALAEAARIAQHNMYIEVEDGHRWVRVPAANWGTLTVAIAEAALDQDLSVAFPKYDPKEPAPLPAPKPPGFL